MLHMYEYIWESVVLEWNTVDITIHIYDICMKKNTNNP